MWTTVVLLTTLTLAPDQAPALKLDTVRSTNGILGPARAAENYVPGDSLTLNFDIDGITVDSKGKVQYSIAIEVTNVADKSVVFRQPGQKMETVTVFGGNRIQGFAHLDLGTEQAPGDYAMTVTVTDLATKATKDLTHKFTVVKPDFAIVRFKTSGDREGDFPVPVLGQGQTIWLNFGIVGFARDKTSKQPSVMLELNVLDDAGKATLDKPLSKVVGTDVPEKNLAIPLQFPVALTRAGKFTFEITATDQVTKKTTKFTLPLTVQPVK
jgi:hypothetical protein